jgi:hypothetical protein
VSLAAEAETILVELDGGTSRALLYAGGTTGLVLVAPSAAGRAFCATLGEHAEAAGLSALAFADEIPGEREIAVSRASMFLEGLGVQQVMVVAVGADGGTALRAAAGGGFAAVTLIDPVVAPEDLEPLLAEVPAPKLVLVRSNDAESQRTAEAVNRHAVGPLVVRHLWGDDVVADETAAMVAEATLAFAIGACGDGRAA